MENPKRWIGRTKKNYYSSSPFFLFFHYIPFYSAWVFNSAEEDISSMFIIMEHFAELYSPPRLYSPLPSAYPLPFSTFPSTTFQFASRVCPIPTSCFSSPLSSTFFSSPKEEESKLCIREFYAAKLLSSSPSHLWFAGEVFLREFGRFSWISMENKETLRGFSWGNRPELVEQTGFFVASGTLK